MKKSRAIVQTAPRSLETREIPIPELTDDTALLRIEACGICGSDAEQFEGRLPVSFPVIPGHEPLGIVDRIGDRAAKRWGVDVGDRVAVEAPIPCGHCRRCLDGLYHLCRGRGRALFAHGYVPLDVAPSLWGGWADYMHLDAFSIVHRVDPSIPAGRAALFNPLGAGFRWAVDIPRTGPSDVVLILGPGQRGLSSVVAARTVGARKVLVAGLSRDAAKLEVARRLGADATVDVEKDDLRDWVRRQTDGEGADVVVEVTSNAPEPVASAILCAATRGRVVLAGVKGFLPVPDFVSDWVVVKELSISGAFAVTRGAYDTAIRRIEASGDELDVLHTHSFPLDEVEEALATLAGEGGRVPSIHSTVVP